MAQEFAYERNLTSNAFASLLLRRVLIIPLPFRVVALRRIIRSAGLGFQNLAQFSHMLCCPDPAKM